MIHDASTDNHSRSPKTLYIWAAICKPLWIVGSAIGNLRRPIDEGNDSLSKSSRKLTSAAEFSDAEYLAI